MKKKFAGALALAALMSVSAFMFTSCDSKTSQNGETEEPSVVSKTGEGEAAPSQEGSESGEVGGVSIANPLVGLESASEFEALLGFTIDAPAGATDITYTSINNTIADVGFTFNGLNCTYRAANGGDDISGIFYTAEGEPLESSVMLDGTEVPVTVKHTEAGDLAVWNTSEMTYSLWCADSNDTAAVAALVQELFK